MRLLFYIFSFIVSDTRAFFIKQTSRGVRSFKQYATSVPVTEAVVQDQQVQLFEWLADNSGVLRKVTLAPVDDVSRGLIAVQNINAGDVAMEVPSNVCLWARRDGVVSGLQGQTELCWEQVGDLRVPLEDSEIERGMTWDVRLALAVHEATGDPQIGGRFWDLYTRLLPQPHTVTVPLCFPPSLLVELQDQKAARAAGAQIQRLKSLAPEFVQTYLSHRVTAMYAGGHEMISGHSPPYALPWAFALVRSRCFTANPDLFAFVPFLDMANHDFYPNANFTYDGTTGMFKLAALTDIRAGDPVTISYGGAFANHRLATQYGFIVPDNPNASPLWDWIPAWAASASDEAMGTSPFVSEAIKAAAQAVTERSGLQGTMLQRHARRSSSISKVLQEKAALLRGSGPDEFASLAIVCAALLSSLSSHASTQFTTSLEEDEQFLEGSMMADESEQIDPRLWLAVTRRVERKREYKCAVQILEECTRMVIDRAKSVS